MRWTLVVHLCVCLGEYVFSVDSDDVDIVFTENETNSVRRRRVLDKRQLKKSKLSNSNTVCVEVIDTDQPVSCLTPQRADTGPSATSTTTTTHAGCATDASSTHSAADLSQLLSVDDVVMTETLTDSSDTDGSSDEDSDSCSHLQGSVVTAHYTKDAFHRYIIAGS